MIPTSLLTDTITVEPFLGRGGKGLSYGDPYEIVCVLTVTRSRRRSSGDEDVTVTPMVTARDLRLSVEDRVTLPTGERLKVASVEPVRAGRRISHIEAILS
jgi:hypothetical protein